MQSFDDLGLRASPSAEIWFGNTLTATYYPGDTPICRIPPPNERILIPEAASIAASLTLFIRNTLPNEWLDQATEHELSNAISYLAMLALESAGEDFASFHIKRTASQEVEAEQPDF